MLERLDTILGEEKEQLNFVPTELPPALEDILEALKKQAGIEEISVGRQVRHSSQSPPIPSHLMMIIGANGQRSKEPRVRAARLSKSSLSCCKNLCGFVIWQTHSMSNMVS